MIALYASLDVAAAQHALDFAIGGSIVRPYRVYPASD